MNDNLDEDGVPVCMMQTAMGTREMPPEYCDEDAAPGEDYCAKHMAAIAAWEEVEDW